MSLSKIVVTGKVVRKPEKRFTGNNLAITSFTINIGADNEEKIVRVFAVGKLAETTEATVQKGSSIIVDGRLQTNTVKTEAGVEKKIVEINAQGIELISASAAQSTSGDSGIDASDFDFGEDVNVDDLIGEDEIPF
jgi:single-strand DNA-binding protein